MTGVISVCRSGQSSEVFRNFRNATSKHCRSVRRNERERERKKKESTRDEERGRKKDGWGRGEGRRQRLGERGDLQPSTQ